MGSGSETLQFRAGYGTEFLKSYPSLRTYKNVGVYYARLDVRSIFRACLIIPQKASDVKFFQSFCCIMRSRPTQACNRAKNNSGPLAILLTAFSLNVPIHQRQFPPTAGDPFLYFQSTGLAR